MFRPSAKDNGAGKRRGRGSRSTPREPCEYYERTRPPEVFALAHGTDSYRSPIANSALDGVFTIREYGDADALRRYLTTGTTRAVVMGGGLLGLEAARQLAHEPRRGGVPIGCIQLGSRGNCAFAAQHLGTPVDAAEVRARLW